VAQAAGAGCTQVKEYHIMLLMSESTEEEIYVSTQHISFQRSTVNRSVITTTNFINLLINLNGKREMQYCYSLLLDSEHS